jgi:hypothetical protein
VDREKQIYAEVEKTLQALDHVPKLEANPFLYTRIKAVLDSDGAAQKRSVLNRAGIKGIAFSLLVVFNLITAIYFFTENQKVTARDELIYALSNDYVTAQNGF